MIIHCAISSDVAQCSFNKCTAKQMSFESGFKCGQCFSTSDLFWKLVPTAAAHLNPDSKLICLAVHLLNEHLIAKSGLPLFCVNPCSSQNPGSSVLDELQLSNGLLWKAGEETITIVHPAGDKGMNKFLQILTGNKTFNSCNVFEMIEC